MDTTAKRLVSQAGAVLLVATAGKVRLDRELSAALSAWRKRWPPAARLRRRRRGRAHAYGTCCCSGDSSERRSSDGRVILGALHGIR